MDESFEIKHYFDYDGVRTAVGWHYFRTEQELERAYALMLDWIKKNCQSYHISAIHNVIDDPTFLNLWEDLLVGYCVVFNDKSEAMAFKLVWLD